MRNDGLVWKGMIVEQDDCDDNYLAELAAILDQADAVPKGSRVVIMLDATSPVHTFIKLRVSRMRGGVRDTTARHGWIPWTSCWTGSKLWSSCGKRRTSAHQ